MSELRRNYDPEFGEGAVRVVVETRKPIAQVARDLGVNSEWISPVSRTGSQRVLSLGRESDGRGTACTRVETWVQRRVQT